MRCQGVGECAVKVADGELRLGEVVVGFHVLRSEAEAGLAVGDDGFPVAQLEAGHGAVSVESWVFGVCDDAELHVRLSIFMHAWELFLLGWERERERERAYALE